MSGALPIAAPPTGDRSVSPRMGIKAQLERLDDIVRTHDDALHQQADAVQAVGSEASAAITALEARMKAFVMDVKKELIGKLNGIASDVVQLQQQINVLKSDQNVIGQQGRETAKRIDDLGSIVAEVQAELLGE